MPEFDRVGPPWWADRPVIVLGCGPSLKGCDLTRLRGLGYVVAVKAMIFEIEWADAGFGIDLPRLREWMPRFESVRYPVWWAVPEDREIKNRTGDLRLLRRLRGTDLSDEPDAVYSGGTSGLGAIAFSWLMLGPQKAGASIYLFGFDHQPVDGEWHYNRRYYGMGRTQRAQLWRQWANRYKDIAGKCAKAGVSVVNASPDSLIDAFPKVDFNDAIESLERMDRVRSA